MSNNKNDDTTTQHQKLRHIVMSRNRILYICERLICGSLTFILFLLSNLIFIEEVGPTVI